MAQLWGFITDFFTNLGNFWEWLNAPLYPQYLGDFAPIHLFSVGGIMIILTFWLVHLINPFN